MEPTFRELTAFDILSCMEIMKENYPQDNERFWDAVLEKDIKDVLTKQYPAMFLVAILNEAIVGFGCYVHFENLNLYRLSWINIPPKEQGKGIGSLMVKELEKYIMKSIKKESRISLETDKPIFYEKLGYDYSYMNSENSMMVKKLFPASPF